MVHHDLLILHCGKSGEVRRRRRMMMNNLRLLLLNQHGGFGFRERRRRRRSGEDNGLLLDCVPRACHGRGAELHWLARHHKGKMRTSTRVLLGRGTASASTTIRVARPLLLRLHSGHFLLVRLLLLLLLPGWFGNSERIIDCGENRSDLGLRNLLMLYQT
jgi:hypothetical protein